MSQTLNLKVAGLYTAPNQFSGSPDGGLLVANNVTVDQTDLAASRRGFESLPGTLPLSSDRVNRFDYYGGMTDSTKYLIAQWGAGKFGFYDTPSSTWTPYSGTFNPPDPVLARTRFLQQNNNLYLTTSGGIFKLDSVENDTPKEAGVPAGLDVQLSLENSSGFFSQNPVGTFVATVTNGSPTITGLTATPGNIAVGQYLSDTNNFITGATISFITAPALALVSTIATQAGSYQVLVTGPIAGLAIGQLISSASATTLPSTATVTALSGASVTPTGNTHSNTTIDGLSSLTGIVAGMFVTGSGITAGTTVTAVGASSVTISVAASSSLTGTALTFNIPASVSPTGTVTMSSVSITSLSSITGIVPGMTITGTDIPAGTTVIAASGTTVTMSAAATGTPGAAAITFAGAVYLVSNPATATNTVLVPLVVSFTNPGTITMSASSTGTSTEVITYSAGSQVAYRLIWGYKDANNNIILGAPTQWTSITNDSGGTRNVHVRSTIPAGITSANFYQLFRTFQTATATTTPPDEMQQCFEGNPTTMDFTNGYVEIDDSTIDGLLGTSLYTSPSQQGIGQAYAQPPLAKDFCSFYGYVLYANTTSQQSLSLTLTGVGSPNGVQIGDTLHIGGIAYVGGSSEIPSSNQFQVISNGTPAQNITNTTNSLVRVINRSTTSINYATNVSGPTGLPGQMVITTRSLAQAAFSVTASAHGSAYNPPLPTSGATVISTADTFQNGIFCSVENQPEAVPTENLLPLVGSAGDPILRIIALRSYVVILKTDGVFRLVGTNLSNFQILPFDYTTQLVAPDSAVSLNNQVWCLANQGVVSISDTGVQQQSWTNINNVIQELFGTAYAAVQQYASGIGYETDHKYILGLPTNGGDTQNNQVYTYNIFTSAWTRWTRQFTCGFIPKIQNVLYLGNSQNNTVVQERKTGTYTDFIDEAYNFPSISAFANYTVTLSSTLGIKVGDLLYQNASVNSVIISIDPMAGTVTVNDLLTWSIAGATIFPAIENEIQWKPVVAGNAAYLRQYCEGDLLFNTTGFDVATISFSTELSQTFAPVPLTGTPLGNWGFPAWGEFPWGGANLPTPLRFYIPLNSQLGSQLNVDFFIRQAYSNWSLEGVNIVYNDINQEMDG